MIYVDDLIQKILDAIATTFIPKLNGHTQEIRLLQKKLEEADKKVNELQGQGRRHEKSIDEIKRRLSESEQKVAYLSGFFANTELKNLLNNLPYETDEINHRMSEIEQKIEYLTGPFVNDKLNELSKSLNSEIIEILKNKNNIPPNGEPRQIK